jgi:hypothetical protein
MSRAMAKAKNQYAVRKVTKDLYNVVKCDEDYHHIETYGIQWERTRWFCSCPNTLAPVCRHMKMLELFRKKKAIDKPMFYCYDTDEWSKVNG